MTQTHALFLEWYCLNGARKAGRYADENGNAGTKPHTPAPLEADCYEIYETGQTLLATLGYPIFDAVAKPPQGSPEELFFCKSSGADGRGLYTEEGFVVLKDSVGRRANSRSLFESSIAIRRKLVESGVMHEVGDTVVFQRDHLFRTPSAACIALLGRTNNGWIEWKDAAGRTLDELKRQIAE